MVPVQASPFWNMGDKCNHLKKKQVRRCVTTVVAIEIQRKKKIHRMVEFCQMKNKYIITAKKVVLEVVMKRCEGGTIKLYELNEKLDKITKRNILYQIHIIIY